MFLFSPTFALVPSYAFVTKIELVLVMDLMLGGDLKFWLNRKKRFTLAETQYHAGRIFLAIKHMHKVFRALRERKIR